MIAVMRALVEIKKVGEEEEEIQNYRRQFGKLREISVFPFTKLIMDVAGIPNGIPRICAGNKNPVLTPSASAPTNWPAARYCRSLSPPHYGTWRSESESGFQANNGQIWIAVKLKLALRRGCAGKSAGDSFLGKELGILTKN